MCLDLSAASCVRQVTRACAAVQVNRKISVRTMTSKNERCCLRLRVSHEHCQCHMYRCVIRCVLESCWEPLRMLSLQRPTQQILPQHKHHAISATPLHVPTPCRWQTGWVMLRQRQSHARTSAGGSSWVEPTTVAAFVSSRRSAEPRCAPHTPLPLSTQPHTPRLISAATLHALSHDSIGSSCAPVARHRSSS